MHNDCVVIFSLNFRDGAYLLTFLFIALLVVTVMTRACETRLQAPSFLSICKPRCADTDVNEHPSKKRWQREFMSKFGHYLRR
jgi:hypothetical protein